MNEGDFNLCMNNIWQFIKLGQDKSALKEINYLKKELGF